MGRIALAVDIFRPESSKIASAKPRTSGWVLVIVMAAVLGAAAVPTNQMGVLSQEPSFWSCPVAASFQQQQQRENNNNTGFVLLLYVHSLWVSFLVLLFTDCFCCRFFCHAQSRTFFYDGRTVQSLPLPRCPMTEMDATINHPYLFGIGPVPGKPVWQ